MTKCLPELYCIILDYLVCNFNFISLSDYIIMFILHLGGVVGGWVGGVGGWVGWVGGWWVQLKVTTVEPLIERFQCTHNVHTHYNTHSNISIHTVQYYYMCTCMCTTILCHYNTQHPLYTLLLCVSM